MDAQGNTVEPEEAPKVQELRGSFEQFLRWWTEIEPVTKHANVVGIRLVCEKDGKRTAFVYGEV